MDFSLVQQINPIKYIELFSWDKGKLYNKVTFQRHNVSSQMNFEHYLSLDLPYQLHLLEIGCAYFK